MGRSHGRGWVLKIPQFLKEFHYIHLGYKNTKIWQMSYMKVNGSPNSLLGLFPKAGRPCIVSVHGMVSDLYALCRCRNMPLIVHLKYRNANESITTTTEIIT